MDASRLLALLNDLDEEIASGYEERLAGLAAAFVQQRDNPSQDLSQDIKQARTRLEDWLQKSRVNEFVPSKSRMLELVGGSPYFGLGGLRRVGGILDQPGLGPAAVVSGLEAFRAELATLRQHLSETSKGMTGLHIKPDALEPDEYEVGVLLPDIVTKRQLATLNKQLQWLNNAIRALQELAGEERREVVVRAAASGSIEVYFLVGVFCADLVAKLVDRITVIIERVLRIRAVAKEMANLEMSEAVVKAAAKEEETFLDRSIGQLAEDLISAKRANLDAKRVRELQTQVTVSVKHTLKLVDEGGVVEVSVPAVTEEEFQPPVPTEGEPADPERVEAARRKWQQVQKETVGRAEQLRRQGAAVARLPARPTPILNLPEPEEVEEEPAKPEEEGRRRK